MTYEQAVKIVEPTAFVLRDATDGLWEVYSNGRTKHPDLIGVGRTPNDAWRLALEIEIGRDLVELAPFYRKA